MHDLSPPIMSTAEKIKRYREILNATQTEIAKNICTRSYIGAIENGQPLTPAKAIEIAARMNELAAKRDVGLHITAAELLESEEAQATRYLNKVIDELTQIDDIHKFENGLAEIEKVISTYEMYIHDLQKYKLYEMAYTKYFENIKYYECENYVIKCFVIANKLQKDTTELILMLTRIYGFLHKYESIITWGKEYVASTEDTQQVKAINRNVAKAYKKLNQIDQCIKHLKEMERFTWTYEEALRSRILYAECLRSKNETKIALDIYLQLLKEANENKSEYLLEILYANIAEINLTNGNYKSALFFINKALQPKKKTLGYEQEIQQNLFYDAFKIHLSLDNFDQAQAYFIKTVTQPGNNNDPKLVLQAFKEMIKYCSTNKKETFLIKIPSYAESAIRAEVIKYPDIIIHLYTIMDYYKQLDRGKFDKVYQDIFNITKLFL